MFYIYAGKLSGILCIRLNGNNVQGTIRAVEKLWNDFSDRQPFQYSFFADEFNKQYETEFKAGRIFILFSFLAIFIACLGLIGLITYMTTIRTREIGIRKTFGAQNIVADSFIAGSCGSYCYIITGSISCCIFRNKNVARDLQKRSV